MDPYSSIVDKLQHEEIPWVRWSLVTQGQCTEVCATQRLPKKTTPPERKAIQQFSNASRLRLLRLVAKIDWEKSLPALFITLTTPDCVADSSPAERTDQREEFKRQIERYLGKPVGVLWRVEWKVRRSGKLKGKMIHHFHLIICNVSFIPWQVIRRAWAVAIKHNGILKTWVRRVYSPLQCAHYCAKYISKNPSLDYHPYLCIGQTIGRQWGLFRSWAIPRGVKQKVFHLWEDDIAFLKSIRRQKMPGFEMGDEQSFTLFGADVAEGIQLYFEDRLVKETPEEYAAFNKRGWR